ncbi:MAG: hypothetical protein NC311_15385 [Muribaculaceae bacterium]|nr:hypothetical protein [Muribaculaceae bacterium]
MATIHKELAEVSQDIQSQIKRRLSEYPGIHYAVTLVAMGHDGHMVSTDLDADPVELAKMMAALFWRAQMQGPEYNDAFMEAFDKRMEEVCRAMGYEGEVQA